MQWEKQRVSWLLRRSEGRAACAEMVLGLKFPFSLQQARSLNPTAGGTPADGAAGTWVPQATN